MDNSGKEIGRFIKKKNFVQLDDESLNIFIWNFTKITR